jgi:hypothetical protein
MTITTTDPPAGTVTEDPPGWFADVRTVLDAAQANPSSLPRPHVNQAAAQFRLTTTISPAAPRILLAAESVLSAALGVTFTPRYEGRFCILSAVLPGGLRTEIWAWADAVAERRVTGTEVTDVIEWVRKPVDAEVAA